MTEDEGSSVEQTREEIEALLGATVTELGALIKDGGKKTLRIKCEGCGASNSHEVQVADADLLVKALSALSSAAPRLQSKDDASSVKAVKLNADLAALSSTDLAERIILLEEALVSVEEGS